MGKLLDFNIENVTRLQWTDTVSLHQVLYYLTHGGLGIIKVWVKSAKHVRIWFTANTETHNYVGLQSPDVQIALTYRILEAVRLTPNFYLYGLTFKSNTDGYIDIKWR